MVRNEADICLVLVDGVIVFLKSNQSDTWCHSSLDSALVASFRIPCRFVNAAPPSINQGFHYRVIELLQTRQINE